MTDKINPVLEQSKLLGSPSLEPRRPPSGDSMCRTAGSIPATGANIVRYEIALPFPLSTNRLWRAKTFGGKVGKPTWENGRPTWQRGKPYYGVIGLHLSPEYTRWKREADALYMTQKVAFRPKMLGVYEIHCIFSAERRRSNQDGDNLTKCVNDWLQRAEIIKDDCLCERGSWAWGLAPSGCIVQLKGELYDCASLSTALAATLPSRTAAR